jgi:glycosyltransferase involved in cell wall biosynthesis
MPVRIAFPLIGGDAWTGGYVYLKNTLEVIRSSLADELEPSVFLTDQEITAYGSELAPLVDGRIIRVAEKPGRGRSLVKGLLIGTDNRLASQLRLAGVKVVFEVAQFYGWRFALPTVSWMPDFQHRLLPDMFSGPNRWRRELGFRMQIGAGRTIMVSSHTSRHDLERFFPASRGRSNVVRFASAIDIALYRARGDQVRLSYGLPLRFLFLPNQFWRHKNHMVVVEALAQLKREGTLGSIPPIVLSGQNKDTRGLGHFQRLMTTVHAAGVGSHFRYLGLLPLGDVLSLNAAAEALINPSLVEGWSTTIEEAKALGTSLFLSDRAIHREQAPHASFFDPLSAPSVAKALLNAAQMGARSRPPLWALLDDQKRRIAEHAHSLGTTVAAALGRTSISRREDH